ncbi:DUF1641 domain-containing protein [Sporosarcina sp. HYO08]|uniref:DUF1641 domain-containing protein n=1 Tax=Sporosarcina sp. HYO08 TaxID=1759557 RepID=UPI000791F0E3|nr:DUF1641 domain-containing protein [Sporosarcina sp. HYO08]KXH81874.1 hypothetical protein AU377_06315 [Sporosarcina sp. HYO08]
MAEPITTIIRNELTEEQSKQKKLEELQTFIAEQDEALQKLIAITGELDQAGVLDAVQAMAKAKDAISKIAIDQVSKEPVTNLINHVMNVAGVFSSIDPAVTEKLANGLKSGMQEAELYQNNGDKVSVFQLLTALNDPDINRAVKFGLDFLKGMGKELEK